MGAILDDATAIDGDDAVGLTHCGKSVGDHEDRAALADPAHIVVDDALALIVERAGRLVKDQNAGVCNQGAGNCDSLPLTARKAAASLADDRILRGARE